MALELIANRAITNVVSGGTTAPAQGTQETWAVTSSSGFPAASNTITPPTQFHIADTAQPTELIAVTNVSGTAWTVIRGSEGTSPVAHSASGFTVYQALTAGLAGACPQWFNVRSILYGAKGDGAADDTAAIQAAINAANTAGGGVLYYPAGTYKANGLTTYANIIHAGDGWSSVIKQTPGAADSTYLFSVNPGSGGTSDPAQNPAGIGFFNLALRGSCDTDLTFTQHVHLLNLNAVSDVTVQGCLLKGFRGDAIYLGSGNSGGLERHNERIRVTGNTFDGINNNNRNAISIVDGTAVQVTGNTFQNCTASTMPGAIDMEPNGAVAYARVRGIVIAGNTFRAVGGNGGVVNANISTGQAALTVKFQNITVIGNTFESCTNSQVFTFQQAQTAAAATVPANIIIAHNACSGGSSGYRPFDFEGIKGLRLEGNAFEGFGGAAFFGFSFTNSDITLAGNTFYGCGGTDGEVLAIANMLRLTLDRNLFDESPFDIIRFQTDGASAGTSGTIWALGNLCRNGGGSFSTKAAGHTLTASSNRAQFNDLSGLSSPTVSTAHWAGQPNLTYSRSGAGETTALAQWRTQFLADQALTDSTTA